MNYKFEEMNISSAIILTSVNDNQEIVSAIRSIKGCEIHLTDGPRMIVSIEAEDIAAETAVMKSLENIPGVISVSLAYAYSEDELHREMDKLERAADYPEWLNDDTQAGEIPYSGNPRL